MSVKTVQQRLLIILFCLSSMQVMAEGESIRVMALFADKAMLMINGQNRLLRKGEEVDGVTLLSSSGRGALVRLADGSEKKLALNQTIHQAYKKTEKKNLTIYSNRQGMFLLTGKINGKPVRFLLDTGATSVAISSKEADRLGLSYRSAARGVAQTASHLVPVWHIKLDKVKVGDISIPNVDAVVLKGDSPQPVLLGMSFLKHLNLQRNGASMLIEKKY